MSIFEILMRRLNGNIVLHPNSIPPRALLSPGCPVCVQGPSSAGDCARASGTVLGEKAPGLFQLRPPHRAYRCAQPPLPPRGVTSRGSGRRAGRGPGRGDVGQRRLCAGPEGEGEARPRRLSGAGGELGL